MVDERGVPLSIVITGANRHDVSQLENVLMRKVVSCPEYIQQHLCADAAYTGDPPRKIIEKAGYKPHVRSRGEEIDSKNMNPDFKARRWVVESTFSWLNRFRKLHVRYEKKECNYMALTQLAATIIALRKIGFIYG